MGPRKIKCLLLICWKIITGSVELFHLFKLYFLLKATPRKKVKVNVKVYSLVSSAKRYSPNFTQLPPGHKTRSFKSHLNSPRSIQPSCRFWHTELFKHTSLHMAVIPSRKISNFIFVQFVFTTQPSQVRGNLTPVQRHGCMGRQWYTFSHAVSNRHNKAALF